MFSDWCQLEKLPTFQQIVVKFGFFFLVTENMNSPFTFQKTVNDTFSKILAELGLAAIHLNS